MNPATAGTERHARFTAYLRALAITQARRLARPTVEAEPCHAEVRATLLVACPRCGAARGEPCREDDGPHDAEAAYIAGRAGSEILLRLEWVAGLTLSDEARARILSGLRDLLVPEIAAALAQDEAAYP